MAELNYSGLLEITNLGVPFGWRKGSGDWAAVQAAIDRQDPVQVIQEAGSLQWHTQLPPKHSFYFGFPEYTATIREQCPPPKARVWISPMQRQFALNSSLPKVQWHPRVLWVGLGCQRGTSRSQIEKAIQAALRTHHLAEAAIAGLATIDTKAAHSQLVEFCRDHSFPLRCFSAALLSAVSVPNPSRVAETKIGTPSVAEAAAILAAQEINVANQTQNEVVRHLLPSLRISKQIFRESDSEAVTVAVAEADREQID